VDASLELDAGAAVWRVRASSGATVTELD
jgi:hypothetical protein